ncbi:MAG: histidine kinase, dimerization and phosphoacceptor region [Mycobacterium sp.]|nr:histidine kinase, dimerization and phosphoacceptor region [Mycobacterium sp.]
MRVIRAAETPPRGSAGQTMRKLTRRRYLWAVITRRGLLSWFALPTRRDAIISVTLLVLAEIALQTEARSSAAPSGRLILAALAAAATLPLLWRRRAPLTAFAAVLVPLQITGPIANGLNLVPPATQGPAAFILAGVVAAFSCSAHGGRRAAMAGCGLLTLAFCVVALPKLVAGEGVDLGIYVALGVFVAVGWLFHGRELRVVELEEWGRFLERDRDQKARIAANEERARIARELHDVVAHSVSVMVVQAGAARHTLPTGKDPETRETLAVIELAGRQALVELRRLLGILRTEDDDPSLTPVPGMSDVENLVAQMRTAGLPVTLHRDGDPVALPPGIDLSAYRIVQEALTNTLKHAGPSHTDVTVRYREDCLELEMSDHGGFVDSSAGTGAGGHGLVGMRERVALYGGTLEAGPSGIGYLVRARLPLTSRPS